MAIKSYASESRGYKESRIAAHTHSRREIVSHVTGYPARSRDRSCDRHTATATWPSHPWPSHVPGHVPGHMPGHVMSHVPSCVEHL